jgi:multiple sugar transport system substrate-binding protein
MTARKTVAAALLVAAVALAGCGRSNTSSGGGEQAKGIAAGPAKGAITVWAMGTEGEQLGKFAKTFEQANPGSTVKVTAVPWNNAHDKRATAIAGRTTPDVSLVGTTWMAEFAKTGALDPTPTAIDKSAFFEGPWSATVVNGTSYGVPWYADTRVLYYRKDMAAKAGLQPPTTWDQLKSFAAALQRKGGASTPWTPPSSSRASPTTSRSSRRAWPPRSTSRRSSRCSSPASTARSSPGPGRSGCSASRAGRRSRTSGR